MTWTQYTDAAVAVYEAAERAYRTTRVSKGPRAAHTAAMAAAKKAGAASYTLSVWDVATTVQDVIDPS